MGRELLIPDLATSSAGTRAVVGQPMHALAESVLEQLGGSGAEFSARQLTPRIASDADLILTMTKEHRDTVLELTPHKLRATFTLEEAAELVSQFDAQTVEDLSRFRPLLAPGRRDIDDPMGQHEDVFEMVGMQIAALLRSVLRICK